CSSDLTRSTPRGAHRSTSSGPTGASSPNGSNSSAPTATPKGTSHGRQVDRTRDRFARTEEAVQAVPRPRRRAARAIPGLGQGTRPLPHGVGRRHRRRDARRDTDRPRRAVGARGSRRHARARHRRRRPGRVHRDLPRRLRRQGVDRQGARAPACGDRRGHGRCGMNDTTASAAIRTAGLEKSYGKLAVLTGVDLEVAPGSIFALLGSNGAGKTTLVRILATLITADAGTASVAGFDVATQPARVRGAISLTGQFAAVDEILTGRENLALVARLRHEKNPGAVADELLERFSLTEAGARRAGTYSGGMRRRLDIAMSLIGAPSVIFLDEPTTGLDPEARIEVWDAVKALARKGT